MADEQTGVKISLLPSATSIFGNDILPCVQSQVTRTFTIERLQNYFVSAATPSATGAVPVERTINGYALSSNISLNASDVNARSSSWLPTASEIGAAPSIQMGSITLSSNWTGDTSPYSQTVLVSGATVSSASKVDLQLTPAQIETLMLDDVTGLLIENDSGTLTVYALGAQPEVMTVQCTVMEVN